jgi:hypothetical protein
MNRLFNIPGSKPLILLLLTCLVLIGLKVFQVTILCVPILGGLVVLLSRPLIIVPSVLALIYFGQEFRTVKFRAFIPIAIAALATYLIYTIDPIVTDFYIYLPVRQNLIEQIAAIYNAPIPNSQSHFLLGQVRIEKLGQEMQLTFPRYNVGMGDGGADFVYRSDDRDISISKTEYEKLRTTLPQVPVAPFFKEVRRITAHWFWQEQAW